MQGFFWGGTSFGTRLISVPAMTKSSSASFAGLSFHSYSIFFFYCCLVASVIPRYETELRDSFLLKIGRRAAPCTVHFPLFFPRKHAGSMMFILFAKRINLDVPIFIALLVCGTLQKSKKPKKTHIFWTAIIVCEFNSKYRLYIPKTPKCVHQCKSLFYLTNKY